jgi:hypothetical protein
LDGKLLLSIIASLLHSSPDKGRQHRLCITALLDYDGRQLIVLLKYRPSTSALGRMGKVTDLTNLDEEITIKRKPRASTSARYFKRLSAQAVAYGIPLLR